MHIVKAAERPEPTGYLCEGAHPGNEPATIRLAFQRPDGSGTFDETWLCERCAEDVEAALRKMRVHIVATARAKREVTID